MLVYRCLWSGLLDAGDELRASSQEAQVAEDIVKLTWTHIDGHMLLPLEACMFYYFTDMIWPAYEVKRCISKGNITIMSLFVGTLILFRTGLCMTGQN